MANKKVFLTTGENCEGDPIIVATPSVVTLPNKKWKIKFVNKLDGDPDAFVEFFEADDKGGAGLGEFCPQVGADDKLKVPGDGSKKCAPDDAGDFSYVITAAGHDPLDPVIIIKPELSSFFTAPQLPEQPVFPGGGFSAVALLAMSAPLFVGMLGGIYIGRKMSR